MNLDTYTTYKIGIFDRILLRKRKQIYEVLSSCIDLESLRSILDVGVTADRTFRSSNFLEVFYPHPERITALSDQDASWMEGVFPGLKFVRGDGCSLPFASSSIDLVFSSATVEHVGNFERQELFISECFRVASRYVFLTTPNRAHPFEFHTLLPLIHWLPKDLHRKILRLLGYQYLSQEENLNLLNRADLLKAAGRIGGKVEIKNISFLSMTSNLLLLIEK